MKLVEQTQDYGISFELTKPNQTRLTVAGRWSSIYSVNSGVDP